MESSSTRRRTRRTSSPLPTSRCPPTELTLSPRQRTRAPRSALPPPPSLSPINLTTQIWSVGPDVNPQGEEDYLTLIKTFPGETALNSAALVPGKPYVLVGGGQEAMAVTTTSARQGGFEIRFWHRVFEEEVARVKGGFGPCNTCVSPFLSLFLPFWVGADARGVRIAAHPQSKGYAIGGEDGYVRVHQCVFFFPLPFRESMLMRRGAALMTNSSLLSLMARAWSLRIKAARRDVVLSKNSEWSESLLARFFERVASLAEGPAGLEFDRVREQASCEEKLRRDRVATKSLLPLHSPHHTRP